MKAKIGDWVRFLQDNTFVIGKVEYLGREHATMGAWYHTDVGSVFDEYVLEVRSADAQDTVEALQRELDELQSVFDLGQTRTVEADKLWQEAHGQPEVWPDLGELVGWLMKRHDDARAELEALRDEREKAKGLQSTEEVT